MDILYVIFLSVFSLVVLFLLTKLIGYRQMSEMSMFDYISGITIGSIAAEMATALDSSFLEPLTAMIVYGLLTAFLAFITGKNMKIRRFISGSPYILFNDGHLYEGNFKKGHIDLSEFLVQCRLNGFFDLKELQTAILEENGRISFLAKSEHRPASPSDLNLSPDKEWLLPTYIMDGIVSSMTPEERENPDLLTPSRRRRIANGSGNSFLHMAVNACLTYFLQQGINRIL